MTFQELSIELTRLSRADLLKLRDKVNALLGMTGSEELEPVLDWLTFAILRELIERKVIRPGVPWQKSKPADYNERVKHAHQFLLDACIDGELFNSQQKAKLGKLAARALYEYLKNAPNFGNHPVRSMLLGVHSIALAIDHAFPGYADAKALGIALRV